MSDKQKKKVDNFSFIEPSLITQLQSILSEYADNEHILKELIQNAEDAKATRVCFLLDETQHGTDPDKLVHPELSVHQGPALYAFNDAKFEQRDWQSLRMLQDSLKQEDPVKIGKFGLGFKSVFHLTDLPSVMSDEWVAFIDPHKKYFQVDGEKTTGARFQLTDDRSDLIHQFEPYKGIFGSNEDAFRNGSFNGTLFRFPLRQTKSQLSETCYTSKKMLDLFASFEKDAHLMLLFLKHVECIELCVRRQGSPIEKLFKVEILESTRDNTRLMRHAFLRKITPNVWPDKPEEIAYPLLLETMKYGSVVEKNTFSFVISEYFGGGREFSRELQDMCSDQTCQHLPLVGSAFLVGVDVDLNGDAIESEAEGHVFCSLPLPIQQRSITGLPVHVNGYFSIGRDRGDLKWPNIGQDTIKDKEVLWNQCLIHELVPEVYVILILKMVQLCLEGQKGVTPKHIMQALPAKLQVDILGRWKGVLEPFYTQLLPRKVFYTKPGGWLPISECVLDCSKEACPSTSAVEKVLEGIGVNVVRLPDHVMLAISNYLKEQPKTITPSLTRSLISQAINAGNANLNLTGLSYDEKKGLCKFLGETEQQYLPRDQVKALSVLPLFETIPYGKSMETKFVAVDNLPLAAPTPLPVEKIDTPLLDLSDGHFQNLARLLNVKILSTAAFLTDVIFPELQKSPDKEKLNLTLDYVMMNLQRLQHEKPDFIEHFQRVPFIQNQSGKYVTSMELFDPEDPFLRHFFYAEDMFPRDKFASGHPLMFLRQVGLRKCSDIQPAHLVTSALKLQNLHDEGLINPNLVEKSNAVVKHIHENPAKLEAFYDGKMLKHFLNEYAWMACLKKRPEILPEGLDLHKGKQILLKPRSLLPLEALPVACCVAPVCDSPFAGSVLEILGVSKLPSVKQVLQQMKVISEAYQPREKAKFLHLVGSVYAYLEKEDTAEILKVAEEIQLSDWVWNGEGFTSIDKVVSCNVPQDTRPHLFSLPMEFQTFSFMFEKLGMKSECDARTWVKVLQDIKVHSTQISSHSEKAQQLQLAVMVLSILANRMHEVDDSIREVLLVPVMNKNDQGLDMRPIDDCTYCDMEWLSIETLMAESEDDIVMIHDAVPMSTSVALRVPTLRSRMLDAEELPITGFGQFETISNRIKSLLDEYKDGYSIIKELLQNADDAGATVVKFLYDERSNIDQKTSLLDEGMKECQGPAFWAYNDAMFSEKDFENITKLGGATKEKEVDKIGKFGLGFNAVYNVTDVPSFVSGRYLAIFDPQMKHLGRSIRETGKKINLMKNKALIRKLPHQFFPYQNIFGCHIDPDEPSEYPGTLFRLPLRTADQAACSEISKKPYNNHEMKMLLSLFLKRSDSLLLFTQHVTRIELHHISTDGGEPEMLFAVEKEKLRTITPLGQVMSGGDFDILSQCSQYYTNQNHQHVAERMLHTTMVMKVSASHSENHKTSILCGEQHASSSRCWLLSYAFGFDVGAFQQAGYSMYGAVALPLILSGEDFIPDPLNHEGILFCHLPLPIHTNLPVHLNGSFAVHSNRRHLHEMTDDDKDSVKTQWNASLLGKAICPAYIQLLRDMVVLNQGTFANYIRIWPSAVGKNLQPLVETFYKQISNKIVVLQDGTKHVTLAGAAVLAGSFDEECQLLATEVFVQIDCKEIVVDVPEKVLDALCTLNYQLIKPQLYEEKRFLLEIFLPNVSKLTSEIRDQLLIFSLKMEDSQVLKSMAEVACLPASPDGVTLKKPSELIDPSSKAAKLYDCSDGKFIHNEHIKNSVFLSNLGLKCDFLNWDDIIERGRSIENLIAEDPPAAQARTKLFLRYLEEKLLELTQEDEHDFEEARECLCQMKILPLLQPPQLHPLKWANTGSIKSTLVCANESYLSRDANLLSSCCLLVDEDALPSRVQKFLGLQEKVIEMNDVITQFELILRLEPAELAKDQPESYKQLNSACNDIYKYFVSKCHDDNLSRSIQEKFGQMACILVQDQFLEPSCLTFDPNYNMPPHLYLVPSEYNEFKPLMVTLGVKDRFEPKDYISKIKNIKQYYRNRPVESQELRNCVKLLAGLQESISSSDACLEELHKDFDPIFVPNTAGVLLPSAELSFNDCPWIDVDPSKNLVHAEITYPMSKILGVKTRIREVLDCHSEGFAFGQIEELTNSLKRILKNYPCDTEILKELVQNADDATATEIHFVLDKRKLPTEQVFDDSWKALQGPALCVYNNRPFTQHDLKGIQRLGEGSKGSDPRKTGQYGIGFSSVYHLTDVPTLLTADDNKQQMLCVFDPHCYYIPGANKANPGKRFTNLKTLRETCPDVFTGYLEDQLDNFNLQNSTMFRFPLRTPEMAEKSEISQKVITVSSMMDMFEKFKKDARQLLLFSNYLESIKISIVDDYTEQLVPEYSVYCGLNKEVKSKRREFHEECIKIGSQLKNHEKPIEKVMQEKVHYTLKIHDSEGQEEMWQVVQVLGFTKEECVTEEVKKAYEEDRLALLPRGGIAYLLERLLKRKQIDKTATAGRVFCCLPMPLFTGLPMHINGHFAMCGESRQKVWPSHSSEPDLKVEWNTILCEDIIAEAYVDLLEKVKEQSLDKLARNKTGHFTCSREDIEQALNAYQNCFPLWKENAEWLPLIKAVYCRIAEDNKMMFPCVHKIKDVNKPTEDQETWTIDWLGLKGTGAEKGYFVTEESSRPPKDVLSKCGCNILEVCPAVMRSLRRSEVAVEYISPENVLSFYKTYTSANSLCKLGVDLPSPIAHTPFRNEKALFSVLKYCLPATSSSRDFEGTPLLLTTDDQIRGFSREKPVYVTEYSSLFPKCGSFLNEKLREEFFLKLDDHDKYTEDKPKPKVTFTEDDIGFGLPFTEFNIVELAKCLPLKLEANYVENTEISWQRFNQDPDMKYWISKLWRFVVKELCVDEKNLEPLDEKQLRHLRPLVNWCLLPVRRNGKKFLFRVSRAEEVLDEKSIQHEYAGLIDVMAKLQIPVLDESPFALEFTTRVPEFMRHITASFEKPELILRAVRNAYASTEVDKRDFKEARRFLNYFAHRIEELPKTDDVVDQLKSLPLYWTICETTISLTGCCAYILPKNVLTTEIDSWQSKRKIVFLKAKKKLQRLFDFLECATLSVVDVYCKFILQHFELFSRKAQMCHLQHLYDEYLKRDADELKEERQVLLEHLQKSDTVEDCSGKLHPASYFFDQDVPLFKLMIDERRFLPDAEELEKAKWFAILKELGLNSTVSSSQCVKFAKQISQEAEDLPRGSEAEKSKALHENVRMKSKAMAEHVLSLDPSDTDNIDLLRQIKSIPFIVPSEIPANLAKLCTASNRQCPSITFKGSYIQQHIYVSWTCANILPKWANPFSKRRIYGEKRIEKLARMLEVDKRPSVTLVSRNLMTVCSNYNPAYLDDLRYVCSWSYQFLQQHGMDNGHLHHSLKEISSKPCILIEGSKMFAKPCQTSLEIPKQDEIQPYLNRLPQSLVEYRLLFVALGASESPRIDQYVDALASMHKYKQGLKLNPKEVLLAHRAVKGLFDSLEREKDNDPQMFRKLALLDEQGHLCEASKIIFVDAPLLYDRVKSRKFQFLFNLRDCGLKDEPAELLAMLPANHRPMMLSSCVKEALTNECEEDVTTSGLAKKLQKKILKEEFRSAVVRLAHHQARKSGTKLSIEILQSALDNLASIKVYGAGEIWTHLLHEGHHISGSRVQKPCFVEKIKKSRGCPSFNLFIKNEDKMEQSLVLHLIETLDSILNDILKVSAIFLWPIFNDTQTDFNNCLDKLGICLTDS